MPSERATRTTAFAAMAVLERASEREGVVHMEVGEPDFEPPEAAVEAAVASLRAHGNPGYTSSRGKPDLREAISAYYDRTYGVSVPVDRIVVTPGSSPGLLLAVLATVDVGDRVALTDPYYACYPNFVYQADAEVDLARLDPADGFRPRVEAFADVVDDETAALLLNSPANPTGAVATARDVEGVVDLARETGTTVLSDEVYHGLAFDATEHSVLEYTDDAFVLDGVSKRYGMTGWRLGWMVVPEDDVESVNRLSQNLLICAPNHVQDAAAAAIRAGDDWLADVREEYRARRDLLLDAARDWGMDLGYAPEGAYYLLLDVSSLPGDAFEVADRFLTEANVAVTPGPDFGPMAADTVRVSFASSTPDVARAIERIDAHLADAERVEPERSEPHPSD